MKIEFLVRNSTVKLVQVKFWKKFACSATGPTCAPMTKPTTPKLPMKITKPKTTVQPENITTKAPITTAEPAEITTAEPAEMTTAEPAEIMTAEPEEGDSTLYYKL